jgi:hypothetical protein
VNAIAQLVACATHQPRSVGAADVIMRPCLICGEDAPEQFRNGPAICATCRVRADVNVVAEISA